jgi:hypothetical protein
MSCDCTSNINALNQNIGNLSVSFNSVSKNVYKRYNTLTYGNYSNIYDISSIDPSNIVSGNIFISQNLLLNVLTANYTTQNIGIQNTNPQSNLDISGNVFLGNAKVNGVANLYYSSSNNYISSGFFSSSHFSIPTYDTPQKNYVASNWITRTSAANNDWRQIVWSPQLGIFVAVASSGTGNRVMTSPNGITWTTRTSTADIQWWSLAWAPELTLFAAVANTGTGNRVMTSPDGINWTSRTSPADNSWESICWSPQLRLFCAVATSGTGNRVMTSPDGINWALRTSPADSNWVSVCWSPQLNIFCAIANLGTNRVMTSSDGINWTSYALTVNNSWIDVCWSAELSIFCAVSYDGTGNRVMTSLDGINWTTRTSAADNVWVNITWASSIGLFVSTSGSGTGNRIMSSPDGINWTIRTSSVDNSWETIGWSEELGIFCALSVTGTGNRVMTSQSSHNYNQTTYYRTLYGNIGLNNSSNVLFVNATNNCIGINQTNPSFDLHVGGNINIGTSNYSANSSLLTFDGLKRWSFDTITTGQIGSLRLNSVSGNILNIIGASNFIVGNMNTSNITSTFNVPTTLNGNVIVYGNLQGSLSNLNLDNGVFFINGNNNRVGINNPNPTVNLDVRGNVTIFGDLNASAVGNIYKVNSYSGFVTNGYALPAWSNIQANVITTNATYTSIPSGTYNWFGCDWSPKLGLFVSVSSAGTGDRIITSPDGITWTQRTTPAAIQYTRVCWSPDLEIFCAVAANGVANRVMTSADGINWTTQNTTGNDNQWYSICWSSQLKLFCVAGNGFMMRSSNGTNWTTVTVANDWRGVCWSPDLGIFVAVARTGTGNRIRTSTDGITWTSRSSPTDLQWNDVVWSSKLRLFCAVASDVSANPIMTSSDGITWTTRTISPSLSFSSIAWSNELGIFYTPAASSGNILISSNGINWNNYQITTTNPNGNFGTSTAWTPELGIFCTPLRAGVGNCLISQSAWVTSPSLYTANIYGNLSVANVGGSSTNVLKVDSINNRVGILTNNPAFNLEVIGTAIKSASGAWATSSDMRVKENIIDANIDQCYDTFKNIKLKSFEWSNITPESIYDKHSLGWIAQDVKTYFPNAITYANRYSYDDFHMLDYDQILKNMYGALQKAMEKKKRLENKIILQETFIQNYIKSS